MLPSERHPAAPVSLSTVYASKEEVAADFPARRERDWTIGTIEAGSSHPPGQASIEYLVHIRQVVATLAEEAHLRDPAEFARSWHILMNGSILSAAEGDANAAQRAKSMARSLIREHAGDSECADSSDREWTEWDAMLDQQHGVRPPPPTTVGSPEIAYDNEYDLL